MIYGLVLAGGFSRRMGKDKGLLEYHGMPQREYIYGLLQSLGLDAVHTSCRPDQLVELADFAPIPDSFPKLGLMSVLCTAFDFNPNVAWLVLACDLPLIDQDTLKFLLDNREPSKMATAFRSPNGDFPEPLITLYEPHAHPLILDHYAQKQASPKRLLESSDIHVIEAPNPKALMNVNDPAAHAQVKRMLLDSKS